MQARMSFEAQLQVRNRVQACKHSFDSVSDWLSLAGKQKSQKVSLTDIEALKKQGNARARAKDWKAASESYSAAIELMNQVSGHADLRQTLFVNRSLCKLKLERYADCVKDCKVALKWKPCPKALFRKACAETKLQRWRDAETDLAACETLVGNDPEMLALVRGQQEVVRCAERASHEKELDNARRILCTRPPSWCLQTDEEPLIDIEIDGISLPPKVKEQPIVKVSEPYIPRCVRMRAAAR